MAIQKIQAGGFINAATPEEMDEKFFNLHEKLTKYENMAARGVRRMRAVSDVVIAPATGLIGIGGARGIDCPETGMCWAVHRVSMLDEVTTSAYDVSVFRTGDDVSNVANYPSGSKYIGDFTCSAAAGTAGMATYSKGVFTCFESEYPAIIVQAGKVAAGQALQFTVEGWEVPRSLMWKLVL